MFCALSSGLLFAVQLPSFPLCEHSIGTKAAYENTGQPFQAFGVFQIYFNLVKFVYKLPAASRRLQTDVVQQKILWQSYGITVGFLMAFFSDPHSNKNL